MPVRACLIVPVKNPKKTVHLASVDGEASNGTVIQLWDRIPRENKAYSNQVWLWDGTLFRSSKDHSKCLQLVYGKTENGTQIQLWNTFSPAHPRARNQEWLLRNKNIVTTKKLSSCWHLTGGKTDNSTKIQLWNVMDHPNGTWNLEYLETDPVLNNILEEYRQVCLICPLRDPSKCVHLDGGRTDNGTKICLWDRDFDERREEFSNQLWIWDGQIFRSGKNKSKCLHLSGGSTSNGTKIQLWDYLESGDPAYANQAWCIEGNNIVSRKNVSACWHLDGGKKDNGTKIQTWKAKNHANGSWRLDPNFRRPRM